MDESISGYEWGECCGGGHEGWMDHLEASNRGAQHGLRQVCGLHPLTTLIAGPWFLVEDWDDLSDEQRGWRIAHIALAPISKELPMAVSAGLFYAEHRDFINRIVGDAAQATADAHWAVLRLALMQHVHAQQPPGQLAPGNVPTGPVNIRLAHRPDLVLDLDHDRRHRGSRILIHSIYGDRGDPNQIWLLHGHSLRLEANPAWRLGGAASKFDKLKLEDAEHEAAFVYEDGRLKLASDRRLCLDVEGMRFENGTDVILFDVKPDHDDAKINQLWIFTSA